MSLKSSHLNYLKVKGEFKIACSLRIFTQEEIELLKQFGHWFEGLANGDLEPFTEVQKSFVRVFTENMTPQTKHELLWFKYLGRLKLEQENPEKFKLDYSYEEQGFHTREDYYKLHPHRRNRN
ncbi:DUF413 domain-containing protein [Winogradskyella aquimaris]|uniref:Macrodomain Ori protein n=1 Tax=Winogradskyella aquimaris TaxID=864074 RepID=A0ABU5EP21_9FLAO|nr:DUF413 domain-containing protein [Winogradskyella aquimaris]MDY2588201.1 DUF413 domain-containing protein [Winogradskyella aquimaris]